jgi:hypothetical protein
VPHVTLGEGLRLAAAPATVGSAIAAWQPRPAVLHKTSLVRLTDPLATMAVLPDAALTEAQIAEIRRLAERADALVETSLSANTRKAYGSAWRQWSEWCLGFGLDPQRADAPWRAMHLTALSATRKLSTLEPRRAAVLEIRRRIGFPLHLDDASSRPSWPACAGLRACGLRGRRRSSRKTCVPSCCCSIRPRHRHRSAACATGRCC